ncbi:hypothetical protein M6D81_04555 [Paenibacillus sp. J5C_2022]|uniref:hypothetical protein n=1 Tax=Paenibacillus sp. J5C2022 TaxID=2977129 RepID=UPI0021D07D4F|nr:hypothetical protein [Paenibacillus sp. J5C2022]MCU6707977.1 hypothetical protein [Paenibacillus sp. J5C2022]
MLKVRKSITAATLSVALLGASLAGLPSYGGGQVMPGSVGVASAAEAGLPSGVFLNRMNELHEALLAGEPADVQDVRNLRDEIAALDVEANLHLLDPMWGKISANLPDDANEQELKANLFRIVKAVGSFRYDPQASQLEAIRTNPEFRATLKTIAAAGGSANITIDDFLVFLFGDGGSRRGVEGTIVDELAELSSAQLMSLLADEEGITNVLLQATEKLLAQVDDYTFSAILSELDVTAQDVRALVGNFQAKLQKDVPAIRAMTVAYIRTAAETAVEVSDDGRQHEYRLKVFSVDIPSLVVLWSKESGSPDVSVSANGIVTIPDDVMSASAVIQASLINPYGGSPKMIIRKEVTLTAGSGNVFPAEQFMERMNELREALLAGDPEDAEAVRELREELASLSFDRDHRLIDPIWKPIAQHLPDSVDKDELKKTLFDMIIAIGLFRCDPQASDLDAIRTNPDYQSAIQTLAAAGGVNDVSMDDFLILLFGAGEERGGLEGEILDIVKDMNATELGKLLSDKGKLNNLVIEALEELMEEEDDYALVKALHELGVKTKDIRSTALAFQSKLKHEEEAMQALAVAYIRADSEASVKVSENGRQHNYSLSVYGIAFPTGWLKWSKVSGDQVVKVDWQGKVSIPKNVDSGTAVIQAALTLPFDRSTKVLFQQEVTLVNGDVGEVEKKIEKIMQQLEDKLDKIQDKLASAKHDHQKINLLMDAVRAGNEAAKDLLKLELEPSRLAEVLSVVKEKVNETVAMIINELLEF